MSSSSRSSKSSHSLRLPWDNSLRSWAVEKVYSSIQDWGQFQVEATAERGRHWYNYHGHDTGKRCPISSLFVLGLTLKSGSLSPPTTRGNSSKSASLPLRIQRGLEMEKGLVVIPSSEAIFRGMGQVCRPHKRSFPELSNQSRCRILSLCIAKSQERSPSSATQDVCLTLSVGRHAVILLDWPLVFPHVLCIINRGKLFKYDWIPSLFFI